MRRALTHALLGLIGLLPLGLQGAFEMDVGGLGWRTEKRLERLLDDIIRDPEKPEAHLDATGAEDAILLLLSEMNRMGFQWAKVEYRLFHGDTALAQGEWTPRSDLGAVEWAAGDRVVFQVRRGERAFFEQVDFVGLSALSDDDARAFFYPQGGLFATERSRAYSPGALDAGMRSLRLRLAQLGYLRAEISLAESPEITPTGEVSVRITVAENDRFVWAEARVEGAAPEIPTSREGLPLAGTVFNEESLQDWISLERNRHFVAGYPDVRLSSSQSFAPLEGTGVQGVTVTLAVQPGPRILRGPIRIEGLEQTNEAFLRAYLDLGSGKWLNPIELDAAQYDLGRLGVFRRIRFTTEDTLIDNEPAREVTYTLEERERIELSALIGYGSFEQVRLGLEARALNLFGRAHSGQIRLKASVRSLAGIALYNVPRPIPWLELGQVRLQGLQRKEISFTRQEALLALGVGRGFRDGTIRTSAEYRYELLRSKDLASEELIGDTRATVGSVLMGFSWDTRDRVVSPRTGASLNTQLELASPAMGSDSYFQRFVLRASFHQPMDQGRLRWHFGGEAGVLSRWGAEASELPVNKRFFPGGENSIRGFKEGEASPRDADGQAIGAELYALGHAEFEMWLLESVGVVLFTDGLWASSSLQDTAAGEALFSAGLGVRYNTPLGPLRLEYGHNLNPRPDDPDGTVHLSIGFPF